MSMMVTMFVITVLFPKLGLLEQTLFCCFYSIVKLRKRKSEHFYLLKTRDKKIFAVPLEQ